jgi:hypothetical protein
LWCQVMRGVLVGFAGLEQVNLVNLAQVTNTGVMALAALPNLKRTTVARCAHICESGLQVCSFIFLILTEVFSHHICDKCK